MAEPLLLKIEWNGGELKVGAELTPSFTLIGANLHELKELTCTLDERLVQGHWNPSPNYTKIGNTWKFAEKLTLQPIVPLCSDSVFSINLHVQFNTIHEGYTLVPVEFQTEIFLNIPVNTSTTKKVTIDVQKGAILSSEDIDWERFDEVVIHADANSIIDISKGIIPQAMKKENSEVPPANISSQILLNVDPIEFPDVGSAINSGILLLKATSSNGTERLYHLAAGSTAVLGRSRTDGSNQFIYRFYRNQKGTAPDPVARYLSQRISRNHLRFNISPTGMEIKNLGNEIELMYDCITRKLIRSGKIDYTWKNFNRDLAIKLVHFSSINVRKFRMDSLFESKIQKILEAKRCFPENHHDDLWELGAEAEVSSIRLQRLPKVTENQEFLAKLQAGAKNEYPDASPESNYWFKDLLAEEEEYHLLTRMINLGSDLDTDAIYIGGNQVLPHHATIYYCNHHFGLLNHTPKALACKEFGQPRPLFQGDVLLLRPGMDFMIGDVNFHVYESYTNYLEIIQQ